MQSEEKRQADVRLLTLYGAKWAVLQAMQLDLLQRGQAVPDEVSKALSKARLEIASGCFSVCQIDCSLNEAESRLISLSASLGGRHTDDWLDLLGIAMKGQLTLDRIKEIPALRPVVSDCTFLRCSCGA